MIGLFDALARNAEPSVADRMATAMTWLGTIFHNALGVDRDPIQAALWWRYGATHGDADGQAMLGTAHHLGAGVERDVVAAMAWLIRARDGGSPLAARFFEAVRGTLSPADLAEAERRAALPLEPAP